MKKLSMPLLAIVLFASSWQLWQSNIDQLTVHTTPDPNSPICYIGTAEDYDGRCVSPAAPTPQYVWKQAELKRLGK